MAIVFLSGKVFVSFVLLAEMGEEMFDYSVSISIYVWFTCLVQMLWIYVVARKLSQGIGMNRWRLSSNIHELIEKRYVFKH